jgi:hypothetical protein
VKYADCPVNWEALTLIPVIDVKNDETPVKDVEEIKGEEMTDEPVIEVK